MKDLFNLLTILFVTFLFSIYSCDKATEIETPTTDKTVESYAKNPLNPHDAAGVDHNAYLDEMLKELFRDRSLSRNEVIKKGFERFGEDNPSPSYSYDSLYVRNMSLFEGLSSSTDVSTYLSNNGMGAVAARYFADMLDSIEPIGTTPKTGVIVASAILGIESDIMNNSTLTSTDKTILLCSASVLRHSYIYWEKNKTIWDAKLKEAGKDDCTTCAGFWDTAKEDGKGAVAGGVGAGVATGGAGILPGAAVGGFCNSLAHAIFE